MGIARIARRGARGDRLTRHVPLRRHASNYYRQQGLFELVAARLAGGQAIGPAVRGDRRPALRRGLGQAPRGRRVRAVVGQGADPVGRRRSSSGTAWRSSNISNDKIGRRPFLAARTNAARGDGAVDGGRDAFELCRAAPRAWHEHPPDLSAAADRATRCGRYRRIMELWAQARARYGGDGAFPVRRVRRGRHHVRAGGHAVRHLSSCRSPASPLAYMQAISPIRGCRNGSAGAEAEDWVDRASTSSGMT